MRSIPPVTSTGRQRLRSVDPKRFRTKPQEQPKANDDPYGAGMAPSVVDAVQSTKPERRKPLACLPCGGTNINGAEERDGAWYVWCVACDSRQPAK